PGLRPAHRDRARAGPMRPGPGDRVRCRRPTRGGARPGEHAGARPADPGPVGGPLAPGRGYEGHPARPAPPEVAVKRTRVLLADDHRLVAEGLRSMLEPQFEVVGIVADGRELLAAAGTLGPDVIVLDISMPSLNGIEAVRQLRATGSPAKVVFLTMHR